MGGTYRNPGRIMMSHPMEQTVEQQEHDSRVNMKREKRRNRRAESARRFLLVILRVFDGEIQALTTFLADSSKQPRVLEHRKVFAERAEVFAELLRIEASHSRRKRKIARQNCSTISSHRYDEVNFGAPGAIRTRGLSLRRQYVYVLSESNEVKKSSYL